MIIRNARIADIYGISRLIKDGINKDFHFYEDRIQNIIIARYSLLRLVLAILKPNRIIFTFIHGEKPAGIIIGVYTTDGIGVVNWIYVEPKHRKEGWGKKLLASFENEVTIRGGHKVSISTETAPMFYKKSGYKQEGLLKNHWWKKDFYIFGKLLKTNNKS